MDRFFIGCCVGSLVGIVFCTVQEKIQERDIGRAVQKEMEQLKAMRNDER
ncbi:TPA: hypothetical protein ACGW5N_003123 [Bacillus mobilis]